MVKMRRRGKVVEVEMIRWSNQGKRFCEFGLVSFVLLYTVMLLVSLHSAILSLPHVRHSPYS